jgi:hypothetical protein
MATTTEIAAPQKELDPGMMIRRALFLLVLVLLTLFYLAYDFKGLSHPAGMEQAQIARQIARGEHYQTLCIRPVALGQVNSHLEHKHGDDSGVSLLKMPETYHAPLNPMFESMILSINKDLWKFDPKARIYTPDLLLAGAAMVLLLSSIGVTYLLVSRIFDNRIGGVTAFLMLLCELLWRYSQSGLPQMLMLFLFTFATYFLYKAVENTQQAKPVYLWVALAGGFFSLLAVSHWLTIWMFLGLLMFAAYYFRPRGIQMLVLLGVFILLPLFWAVHNYSNTGDMLGAGRFAFYAGMKGDSVSVLMRDYEMKSGLLNFDGFFWKMVSNFIGQFTDLYGYMGSIVAAPLFFLSLLHPFRRKEIADFRWCLLAMWIMGTIGMTIFGVEPYRQQNTDTNNLHVLFIPLFTAYGLAFLSVLWNRLNLPMHLPLVRNGHFILTIGLSSLPFLLNLPLRISFWTRNPADARCHWPYYVPRLLASLNASLDKNEVLVTDIPWATAWYADRTSVWLPKNKKQFYMLKDEAQEKGNEVAGLLFTPTSTSQPLFGGIINGEYEDWQEVVLRKPVFDRSQVDTMQNQTEFPFREPWFIGSGTIFYTDRKRIEAFREDWENR